jgi:cytoskeletal protein CcmA (bactofilin family)
MAQIIKHRRGSISALKDVFANIGELVMGTGSIGDLNAPVLFIGDTAIAGGYKPVSKIYQGSDAPTISVLSHGSTMDGLPFYSTNTKTLYILNKDGNSAINLTGNIEGNTISGVTITSLTGSNGNFSNLTGTTFTSTNGNITSLTGSNANVTNITGSTISGSNVRVTSDMSVGGKVVVDGDISGSNLNLTGNATIDGNIVLKGSISIGDQTTDLVTFGADVSSSILPDVNNAFDLGSTSKYWKDLYVSGTAYVNQLNLNSIQLTNLDLPGYLNVTGATTLGGTTIVNADFTTNGSNSTLTANYGGNNIELVTYNGATIDLYGPTTINGNTVLTGSVKVTGSIYNDQLTNNRVVIVGANGLLEDDANFTFDGTQLSVGQGNFTVQQGSGNVGTSGSLNVKGATTLDSTLAVTSTSELKGAVTANSTLTVTGSSTFKNNVNVSGDTTTIGSEYVNTNLFVGGNGKVTGSFEVVGATSLDSTLTVTGSATYKSTLNVTGATTIDGLTTINDNAVVNGVLTVTGNTQLQSNLYVSGNLEVLGSSTNVTIQSQTVEIDDNIIRMNAYSPFLRYAGFEVMDSGSSGVSSSMLWDSQNDYWLLTDQNGSGSKFIGTTFGAQGTEVSLTSGTIPKATSANTIGDSLLTENGTTLSYNTNKFQVTASDGATLIAGNVTVSAGGGADAGTKTSAVVFRNSSNVLGYVSTTESTDVLDGILGYKNADGALKFSTVIDGGTY